MEFGNKASLNKFQGLSDPGSRSNRDKSESRKHHTFSDLPHLTAIASLYLSQTPYINSYTPNR